MTIFNSIKYFAFSLTLITLGIISCKKQETVKSDVQLISPAEEGEKFLPGNSILLKAKVKDDDNILMLKSFLIGPVGDTVINILEPQYNKGTLYQLTYKFQHGINYFRTGIFTWHIVVANKFETNTFKRSFQVGEITSTTEEFAIASFDRSMRPAKITLYDKGMQKFSTYSISNDISKVNSLGENIFAAEGNKLVVWNGFTGNEKKTLINPINRDVILRSADKMYASNYNLPDFISTYNANGSLNLNIQNKYDESSFILQVGQTIFSVEYDNNDGRIKLVTYEAATGAYIANVPILRYVNVLGLFSFGDENRVYVMAESPSNSSHTTFFYYNKSLNAIPQLLSLTISARATTQNPIMISSTDAWIFTNSGIYEFNSGDQVSRNPTNSPTINNISSVGSYSYLASETLLMYETQSKHYIYNVATGTELGQITNSNESVMFLKK